MRDQLLRRALALLLAFVLAFSLAPAALADEANPDLDDSATNEPDTPDTGNRTITLNIEGASNRKVTIEPGTSKSASASLSDKDSTTPITLKSGNDSIVSVSSWNASTRQGSVGGISPGVTTITASAARADDVIFDVEVSGVTVPESKRSLTITEGQTYRDLAASLDLQFFGNAKNDAATYEIINDKPDTILDASDNSKTMEGLAIEGLKAGEGTIRIRISANGRVYESERITVTVESNQAPPVEGTASISNPLKFSTILSEMDKQCREVLGTTDGDASLASVTGLVVSTKQGTLYLGYTSPDSPGAGVGSATTYYMTTASTWGPYIKDITFVPNSSYTGEPAEITYTGTAVNGRSYKGRIKVTIEDMHTDVILTARNGEPLDLSAENFAKVCQEQTGSPLSYVIFTLPPASQGVLYRDYNNEMDYGSRVTATERYDRKGLDDITFVPAAGFVGQVTVGYAGYSTTGTRYNGQLVINVTRPLDESIQYQDYGSGEVAFNGGDFDSYCLSMTGQPMRTTGRVSFVPPPASQGALYYRPRTGRGVPVTAEDEYSLTQLSYLVFEAAEGFDGVVRIPFTGTDRDGAPFSGTVELHIQSGAAQNGDIRYTCQPGQSVKLQLNDFVNLCQSMTADRLYYVTFQSLPDYTQGALFYNRTSSGSIGTRVTTATKYFNSAAPYLNNLSFWATQNFRSVEIPFTVASVNGQTFTGLMVISNGEGAGGGQAANVTYTTSGQQPVTFSGANFDAACRQATNSALNYLRFSLPGSGQGILYYDYRTDRAPTALDPSTALYLSGNTSIDKVTFVPAGGAGVCYIPFTATAINGVTFQGTVEITIRAGAAFGSIVRYNSGGTPVFFQTSDLTAASGSGQPAAIRLTGLPDASQGRIYYQYVSPTQYSWLGNTTTVYSVTGDPSAANLVFIPRAGYQGVVTVPYLSTNADGTTSTGSIEITVALPGASVSFDDLGSCSSQTVAAIDYLASQSVVNGTSLRRYEPGASIRRGDFCLMLSRAFRFNVGGASRGFTDVSADAYYAQAINEMYSLGIVNGVGGGRFQPEATISRQDAAVMVCRALEKAGMAVPGGSAQAALANYRDRNRVDSYAQEALGNLVRAGLFPVSGNQLSPQTAITRADMALLLHRAMTNFS